MIDVMSLDSRKISYCTYHIVDLIPKHSNYCTYLLLSVQTVHQMSDNSRRLLNLDGGVKKSSGVNVLPIVAETWAQVRDDNNKNVDWLIASFDGNSKTNVTIMTSGSGGVQACVQMLYQMINVVMVV